ncbi:unnamed protein product, partial [Rotaria sp. Silwood2]
WAQLIHDLHNKTSALVALPNCRMDAIGIIYREFRSERKVRPFWFFIPHETYRLTEQDTIDFVNCIKEYAFISIFNKDHNKEAAEACQYLSMLLPELIVPSLVEQLFSSLDNMTEPHRFTSIIICLTRVARQIVRQTPSYSEGQIYVLPLLMSVLPGIDLNDFQKITVTLEFLDTILKLITCIIREKISDFLSGSFLSPKVRKLVAGLIRALVKGNPIETLKYFLPKTCESIENIMDHADSSGLLIDHKGDIELNWYLILFAEFLRARGDTLLIYKQMIMSIFHRCIYLIHKDSYEAVASAAKHLLKSLSHVYPMEYQLTVENFDEPFVNFLPIRAWGQAADFDNLQIQFHIPNENEIDFACEFVETFLYLELRLLNEKCLKMSNNERLRSLTFIHHIAIGCFRMVPHVDSEKLPNLIGKTFTTQALIENVNEKSIHAAATLWQPLALSEIETGQQIHDERNRANVQSYNNLMESLNLLLRKNTLTWKQQKIAISLLYLLLQNRVPIPSSCIRIFMDFLVHDNIELRKHAEKSITAICRLQKPPRICMEKPIDEILQNIGQSAPTLVGGDHQPGDRHDNVWVTIDGYKQPETQTDWEQTCFLDKSFYGYYTWPNIIKYSMNKRERYTANNMPEQVAILYERFIDKNFIQRSIQLMVFDEEKNEIKFDKTRFLMFKVGKDKKSSLH